jgi:hypothetical protein
MLINPEFGEFVTGGVHPGTGWTATGTMRERFAAQTLDTQHRAHGAPPAEASKGAWWNPTGIPPWDAATQMSWTGRRSHELTRYNWYPAWRPLHVFDRLTHTVNPGRPALLYVGTGWPPTHTVLVIHSDGTAIWCYDPATGNSAQTTRSQFLERNLPFGDATRPVFIVHGTGRRVSA